jgi:stage II sporulation protein D
MSRHQATRAVHQPMDSPRPFGSAVGHGANALLLLLVTLAILSSLSWLVWHHPAASFADGNWPTAVLERTSANSLPATARLKSQDASRIRVGLSENTMQTQTYGSAKISCSGAFKAIDTSTDVVVAQGTAWQDLVITVSPSGFRIADALGRTLQQNLPGPIRFEPLDSSASLLRVSSLIRKGRIPSYRGIFYVERATGTTNKLVVINELPLQEYLKAVVPNELPMRFGLAAVKAQSVAARNYAIRPRERPWSNFDICDSQYCQAYYGAQTETDGSTNAIADTTGLVALYQGDPILALYSSSHGGFSESYENAFSNPQTHQFPGTPLPYLTGHADINQGIGDLSQEAAARVFWTSANIASYDTDSPHYRWTRMWTRLQLEAQLNQALRKLSQDGFTKRFISPAFGGASRVGELKSITVTRRGRSGKAMAIIIQGTGGTWTVQKEFLIRKALSHAGKMLPSANIVLSDDRTAGGKLATLTARGGGFGHGVGMSQYGAGALSRRGYHYSQILQHYYRGVAIGTLPITFPQAQDQEQNDDAPEQLSFYVRRPWGMLYIDNATPGLPITLNLNGDLLQAKLPHNATQGAIPVSLFLEPQRLNTLTVYPRTGQQCKVWIELYPPDSTPLEGASRNTTTRRS